ncbi:P-loop containing nucleoside triphosphate hydrolase protein [Tricladium varicosporioides]|nr:P-loop containing nucleoside triphosphate hydrolase protein [Hymenoscyphus varicosporioides]
MRLLEVKSSGEFSLIKVATHNTLPYAILSHTWTDQEITYQDLISSAGKSKSGYKKIKFCGEQAARDGLQYFWVDTCCIDKSNSTELSTAINSMFRWYQNAKKCYVYLTDVSVPSHEGDVQPSQRTWEAAFRNSRWFTRGWTLQELIAPEIVEFFSIEYTRLGDKRSLEMAIQEITQIPIQALRGDPFSDFSIAERKKWAAQRQTTEEEDLVYCLLGLCEVSMPPIYGEGKEKALFRLTDEVDKRSRIPILQKKPLSTVPFDKDPDFVGRQDILEALELQFSQRESHKRVVLVGLGGVGKSQIAIEFSHRLRSQDLQTWVFWVHASTTERFEQGYRAIAAALELPGWNDPKTDILGLVWRWLSDIRSGYWFLILDNADDTDIFSSMPGKELEQRSRPLSSYIPQTVTGSVLLTTRDRRVASWLSTGYASTIAVGLMTQKDAEQLLFTKIPDGISSATERAELIRELDYLPLAITQAAAYISARATRITVPRYLALYRNDEASQSRLLDEESGDLRRDPGVPNSVIRTWQISFDQIKDKWSSAAMLLSLIAMFDRQGIPEFLLHDICPNDLDFEAALNPLEEFSLISVERGSTRFEIHRLVQLATRKWLERHQELERWQGIAVEVISKAFPNGDYKNWKICDALWPHAQEKITLGAEHPSTLTSMANLASTYYGQGRWKEAEDLFVQAMGTSKRVLGHEHPDTLASMANLASTYRSQRRWKEAEDLFIQVMEANSRVLGHEHPSTLTSMANLAPIYRNQGYWKEAEGLEVQVLEMSSTVLGQEHPDTLTSMANLALTWYNQGRWKEAEGLFVQVIRARKRVLGQEHPSTLTSMANLASTYYDEGHWKKAEDLFIQVIEARTLEGGGKLESASDGDEKEGIRARASRHAS